MALRAFAPLTPLFRCASGAALASFVSTKNKALYHGEVAPSAVTAKPAPCPETPDNERSEASGFFRQWHPAALQSLCAGVHRAWRNIALRLLRSFAPPLRSR